MLIDIGADQEIGSVGPSEVAHLHNTGGYTPELIGDSNIATQCVWTALGATWQCTPCSLGLWPIYALV
jgi:hypothetical protein